MIGWREWASLPDLGIEAIKVKVDTGARSSALHAFRMRVVSEDGEPWAQFEIHPQQRTGAMAVTARCPIIEWRRVRSSNGRVEERPVVRTRIKLGEHQWPIDVTLTNRDEMGFRMLLGRAAVRRRFVIDPGRSYLGGERLARTEPAAER